MQVEAPIGLDSLMSGFKPIVPAVTPTPDSTTETSTDENKNPETDTSTDTTTNTETTDTSADTTDTGDQSGDLFSRLRQELDPELEGEFEETFEGISKFAGSLAEKSRVAGREETYARLIEAAPELDEYLTYRLSGGDPKKYFEVLNQSGSVPADLTSVEAQKQVVTKFLESKGFDADDIKEQLTSLEDTDKLEATAKKYHGKLTEQESTSAATLVEEQKQQALKQKEANEKYWSGIRAVIDTGKIGAQGTTVVPATEREGFFKWLATPVEAGKPQQALDWAAMSEADKLAVQYFIYKKGDLKALANRSQTTTKVDETLRAISQNSGDRMKGGKDSKKANTTIPVSGLDGLKKLFN